MANGTGSVVFRGDPDTVCDEALNYRVHDEQGEEVGGSLLQPGYVVSRIPEDQLKRWVLNQDFAPNGAAANKAFKALENDTAKRINGALIDPALAETPAETEPPIGEMTVAQLEIKAEELGVEVESSDKKGDILEKIEAALADSNPEDPLQTTESTEPPPASGTVTESTSGGQEVGDNE